MRLLLLSMILLIHACDGGTVPDSKPATNASTTTIEPESPSAEPVNGKSAYFGDLHVHTMYSFDAFIFGTTASPDDAYEFAKGDAIEHPGGFDMQLRAPLDFYGVTDHAFYLGSIRAMTDPSTSLSKHDLATGMHDLDTAAKRRSQFQRIGEFLRTERRMELLDQDVFHDAWEDIKAAANRHNDPGNFTAFIAYEYTSSSGIQENLHRNVIFEGDRGPDFPMSRIDSSNPEDLWRWMDDLRDQGMEAMAIPHNSNASNGMMFNLVDFTGNPLDAAYADLRMRNEPLVEISQVKGTSDTHPALSPNDEWADFEIMSLRVASELTSKPEGSYVREALMNGLEFQQKKGFNPFKFGIIAASDTHNATYAGDEDNYWSKVGLLDDEPVERGSVPMPEPREDGNVYAKTYFDQWSAAGLTGVWAEENTRTSIYSAFRRKETFGTSGPRIKVRFFAGADMPALETDDIFREAAKSGVPMGGELTSEGDASPEFLIWASRDVYSAPLQRLQVIKANVRDGNTVERVYDAACSNGGKVDPTTHRCPDNGATVNLTDCSISAGVGDGELKAVWTDPDFDATEHAFYYVRVLENPVCRWST
ncbi:MAG: DUF3604 domain-containing protein, partial [Gammaproteobacteria bacterium]|nr:DUF3604 domain-containing protein [Gammaproteobacteria bacterium]